MKKIVYTLCLLPFAALANPPGSGTTNGAGCVENCGNPTPGGTSIGGTPAITSEANALAASAAVSTAEQAQRQLQAQQQAASASATGGNATSEGSTASASTGSSSAVVGDVGASIGAVVESGAVATSTNVTTNYREAAQAVGFVLTTACGTAAGASGREWTFSVGQGQDAFCKNLALANLYFSMGRVEEGMAYVAKADQLADIDTFFDNLTTILTLGILK